MFYRLNDEGSVLDWSEVKYSDDCLFTEKEIVTAWNGLTYISGEEPQEPQELFEVRIQKQLFEAVQRHLDAKAQELLYDSCLSVCSYIDTGIPKFDDEGRAFRAWRSAVWAKSHQILAEINAETRDNPTEEELIAMLPKLEISYS